MPEDPAPTGPARLNFGSRGSGGASREARSASRRWRMTRASETRSLNRLIDKRQAGAVTDGAVAAYAAGRQHRAPRVDRRSKRRGGRGFPRRRGSRGATGLRRRLAAMDNMSEPISGGAA